MNRTCIQLVIAALLLCAPLFGCARESAQTPRRTALTYPDPLLTEFHKQVLTAMNLSYTVEKTPDGEKVWWVPRTEAEAREVQNRISQYAFVLKACGKKELVTPQTPAGTIKSC